jgi:hypothetical protein
MKIADESYDKKLLILSAASTYIWTSTGFKRKREICEHDTANTYILRTLLDVFVVFRCEPVT